MDVAEEIRRALTLESEGRLLAAIAAYDELAKAGLGGAEPLLRMAALHKELDELAAAVAALEAAEACAPDAYEPKLRLAQIATSTGRDIAAIRYLQAAIAQSPGTAELRVNLADICARAGWLDVGYWAVAPLPASLPDWWARARKTSLDQFSAARAELRLLLRQRVKSEPLDYGLAWEVAQRLYSLGRLALAERLCDGLIARTPDNFPVNGLKAKVLARRYGVRDALSHLESLVPSARVSGDYPGQMARYLTELKQFDAVLKAFADRPDVVQSFDARYLSTVALLSLGRVDDLRDHCRDWMTQSPDEVLPAGVMLGTVRGGQKADAPPGGAASSLPIMQFWDKSDIPADVRGVLDGWVEHNPQLDRTLYDDEAARSFLLKNFDQDTLAVYDLCFHAAMKADYFRIAYLYSVGGLYIDADERCMRPLGSLLAQAADVDLAAVRSGDLMGYLHNYFLGARPKSPVLRIALEEADRVIRLCHAEQRRPSIWQATGPGLITRAAAQHLARTRGQDCDLMLLPLQQYRSFVRNAGDLQYKCEADANWQLA